MPGGATTVVRGGRALSNKVTNAVSDRISGGETAHRGGDLTIKSEKISGEFSSQTNRSGGTLWTSKGEISQKDFKGLVNNGMYKGDVNIISGMLGLPDGSTIPDRGMYQLDVREFGQHSGVKVFNGPDMSPAEIRNVVNGPGTTIGGFCNSGASLRSYVD